MSTIALRLAEAGDADAITSIYAPLVRDTAISLEIAEPTPDEMRRRIVNTSLRLPWLVAQQDDALAGFAYATRHRERAGYAWSVETSVYVAAHVRGAGVGRALYSAVLTLLAQQGYAQAFAGIALPNAASVGLHRAVGFAPVGTFRSVGYKLGNWWDVQWWQRPLQGAGATPGSPPRSFSEIEPRAVRAALAESERHVR